MTTGSCPIETDEDSEGHWSHVLCAMLKELCLSWRHSGRARRAAFKCLRSHYKEEELNLFSPAPQGEARAAK